LVLLPSCGSDESPAGAVATPDGGAASDGDAASDRSSTSESAAPDEGTTSDGGASDGGTSSSDADASIEAPGPANDAPGSPDADGALTSDAPRESMPDVQRADAADATAPVRDPRCQGAAANALLGAGTALDPFLLCLPQHLALVGTAGYALDRAYVLGDAIDASSVQPPFATIGSAMTPFTGSLDGRGHAIGGLPASVFDTIGAGGTVVDLRVAGNVNASTMPVRWGLLAHTNQGTIRKVHASGTLILGDHAAVLLGANESIVEGCSSSGTITMGGAHVGGLVGVNLGTVRRSWSTVSATANGRVGGLVGRQSAPGIVEESYATGAVTGMFSVGGLLGTLFGGDVRNSFARSPMVTGPEAGGLVGNMDAGSMTNCYAASTVSGTGAEGLVGQTLMGGTPTVIGSYFLDTATGTLGTPLSAAQMRMPSSFAAWDFVTVWKFDAAISEFPSLAFQTP
jgi:hypothetical protein